MKREKTVFKVDLRYITYHSHILKTDQSIQAFRETLLEKGDKPMRKRWIKRFAVVALATAVSVYTVPKTGLLAALGLSQTTEAEEASADQKGPGRTSSGGIHVAGGGTLHAWNVTAETSGQSSAAIRSDRGGGTMVVDGGTYTSNGKAAMPPEIRRQVEAVLDFLLQRQWQRRILAN